MYIHFFWCMFTYTWEWSNLRNNFEAATCSNIFHMYLYLYLWRLSRLLEIWIWISSRPEFFVLSCTTILGLTENGGRKTSLDFQGEYYIILLVVGNSRSLDWIFGGSIYSISRMFVCTYIYGCRQLQIYSNCKYTHWFFVNHICKQIFGEWVGWSIKLHALRHGQINQCRGRWLNDLSVTLPETQTLTQCLETSRNPNLRGLLCFLPLRVSSTFKMMQNESGREHVSQCLTQSLSEFSERDKQQCRNSWLRMLPKYSNTKNISRLLRQGFGSGMVLLTGSVWFWNLDICHKCIPVPF